MARDGYSQVDSNPYVMPFAASIQLWAMPTYGLGLGVADFLLLVIG